MLMLMDEPPTKLAPASMTASDRIFEEDSDESKPQIKTIATWIPFDDNTHTIFDARHGVAMVLKS